MTLDIKFLEHLDELFKFKQWDEILDSRNWIDSLQRTRCILLMMQIHGIYSNDLANFKHEKPLGNRYQGIIRRGEVNLLIEGQIFKFLIRQHNETPFYVENDFVIMDGRNTDIIASRVTDIENNRDNGYYFPMLNGEIDKKVMRVNPRNTGKCPGHCVYCQRMHYLPTKLELDQRNIWNPIDIVKKATLEHGNKVFSNLDSILVVTELYGTPSKYIEFCRSMKSLAIENGFSGKFEALAQEIRSNEHVKQFSKIVDGGVFVYTLECFSNRNTYMSKHKALDMENVYNILRSANMYNMTNTVINYIMGIDDIDEFSEGIDKLVEKTPINGIGLNIYYPYSDKLDKIKAKKSSSLKYYGVMIEKLNQYDLSIHKPTNYERCPAVYKI